MAGSDPVRRDIDGKPKDKGRRRMISFIVFFLWRGAAAKSFSSGLIVHLLWKKIEELNL